MGGEEENWYKLLIGSEFLFGVMKILKLGNGDSCTTVNILKSSEVLT